MTKHELDAWFVWRIIISAVIFLFAANSFGIDIEKLVNAIAVGGVAYGTLTKPRIAIYLACILLAFPAFGYIAYILHKAALSNGAILAIVLPLVAIYCFFLMPIYDKFLSRVLGIKNKPLSKGG